MRPIDILENIFTNQISVLHISVPTTEATLNEAHKICNDNNYDVHLVREGIAHDLLLFERSTGKVRHLTDHEIISETTPILDVLELLIEYPQAFIKVKRKVTRIVSRADLDSVPLRIWLYGLISILEVELRNKIKSTIHEWRNSMSANRLVFAEDLYRKKLKRNEEVDLLDCVQITDLSKIICSNWILFDDYSKMISSVDFKKRLDNLNKLRDELAHAQRLTLEWEEIYNLMAFTRMCIATETKVEEV